jgi:hypothetical protein
MRSRLRRLLPPARTAHPHQPSPPTHPSPGECLPDRRGAAYTLAPSPCRGFSRRQGRNLLHLPRRPSVRRSSIRAHLGERPLERASPHRAHRAPRRAHLAPRPRRGPPLERRPLTNHPLPLFKRRPSTQPSLRGAGLRSVERPRGLRRVRLPCRLPPWPRPTRRWFPRVHKRAR